jgi:CBS domain-containing protein
MSAVWFREVCKVTVGDLVSEKRHLIGVEASTPVGTVLNLLKEENILSVAVYGTQGSWLGSGGVDLVSNHRQYIGIVSMMDLLAYILRGNPETVLNQRIVEAVGSTSESLTLWVEPASRPLFFALEQFCKGSNFSLSSQSYPAGTHRALVHDEKAEGSPIRMLTQTDVVHYLIRHRDTFPHLEVSFSPSTHLPPFTHVRPSSMPRLGIL